MDRAWWARTIRRATIIDIDFVRAQGGPRSSRGAIRKYVRGGFRTGMTLNPLFDEQLVSAQLSDAGRVPALYAYLVNDPRKVEASVSWDAPLYAAAHPESLSAPGGPLGHAWRAASATTEPFLSFGAVTGPRQDVTWAAVRSRAMLGARAARGDASQDELGPFTRSTVLVCRLARDEANPAVALRAACTVAATVDADLVVVIEGRSAAVWSSAMLLGLWLPSVQVVRERADVLDRIRAAAAPGSTLLVRGPHAEIEPSELVMLLDLGRERPTAPLWLGWDGAVASAGTIAQRGRKWHFLEGHPAEDARQIGETLDVLEVSGETFATPVEPHARPARTALALTVRAPAYRADDTPATVPDTDLSSALDALSLGVKEWTARGPRYSRRRSSVALPDGTIVPKLRWAIKIAAPPGPPGENWGDTHFARGIADALRRIGQEVVIDAYDARARSGAYLDDVVLALRGPERIAAQPGAFSIMWVISHPDEIGHVDVDGFDRLFAASPRWATSASRRFKQPVEPLLQCTDVRRFHPSGSARTRELVFVGTARGIARPSVVEPIRAGIPVSVYGPDWRGYIPAESIIATSVPNRDLPRLYESAFAVLNDHWPAMQAQGFVSNRLFDVVAAGGRAVSDEVAGITDIFGGAVVTYRSVAELLDLLRGDLDGVFPKADELAEISHRVRRDHSFDARARTLLDAAVAGHSQARGTDVS